MPAVVHNMTSMTSEYSKNIKKEILQIISAIYFDHYFNTKFDTTQKQNADMGNIMICESWELKIHDDIH